MVGNTHALALLLSSCVHSAYCTHNPLTPCEAKCSQDHARPDAAETLHPAGGVHLKTRSIFLNQQSHGNALPQVLESGDFNIGFNAATGKYEDLMKAGIIDPTKVGLKGLHA